MSPDFSEVTEARRKSIERSIQTVSLEEMKNLGEGLLPNTEHPWRDVYFNFLNENAEADFYHAVTHDRVHILYCHTKDRGLWFVPGSGLGPLQASGLRVLKEIVEAHR